MAVTERELERQEVVVPLRQGDDFGAQATPEVETEDVQPVPLLQTGLAAGLSTAAAAWMVGGIFNGWDARVVGLLAGALGAGMGYAIYRFQRPSLQFLLPAIGVFIGAIVVAPDAHAGSSSLPNLVTDALRSGGLLQPPVDFAPGWKLILIAMFVVLGSGAVGVAVATSRPRLAPLVPIPLALGAALVQPPGNALLSSAVTIIGILAAFAVSFGADLGRGMGDGTKLDSGFELRRLGRTGGMVAGLVVAVVALNQAGFLYPSPDQNRIVPPQRPQVPPDPPDVPLFRVTTTAQAPYRLGVIDVYDVKQGAWMLPEQDNRRLERLSAPATLPGPKLTSPHLTATFVVEQASGHLLPSLGGMVGVEGLSGQQFYYDPRQQTIQIANRPLFAGLTYTVEAPLPVSATDLRKAAPADASIRAQFLTAPPVPLEVQAILDKAPSNDAFDRLQFVRRTLYDKVVAAGAGKPVDVSAQRAVQVIEGQDASPYEITATEALLARWAGIPARIGYGYYGGQRLPNGSVEIRPRNGATWLEAYFGQYGWIPIVGTPPQAKPSSSTQQKNQNSAVRAVDALALIVYLPVRVHSLLPLYLILRYWLAIALPFAAAIILLIVFYPGAVKMARRYRRQRWASTLGPPARIGAAYAEFRDAARDLAIGDPIATPLEFLDYVEDDDEHRELAWLVTRGLYGDMRHRLEPDHAQIAENLARSVRQRLQRGQSLTTRMLAYAARSSLRDPYSGEVPNLWWSKTRRRGSWRRRSTAAASLAAALLLMSCGSAAVLVSRPLPTRILPHQLGPLVFVEEPKAEAAYVKAKSDADIIVSEGRVFTLHQGGVTEGSLQVARFKPGYSGSDPATADALRQSLLGTFSPFHGAKINAWINLTADQRIYLWFPPGSDSMALLIFRQNFTAANADKVARVLIDYEAGQAAPASLTLGPDATDAATNGGTVLAQPTPMASGS